jgi:hypothetical protein
VETNASVIREALEATIKEFQEKAYCFLYECDIQAFLQAQLWNRLQPLHDLPAKRELKERFKGLERITTHPVRLEWPLQDGYGRLDIAILARHLWNEERLPWNQRAECGIEIKLWSDPKGAQYIDGLRADYHKLAAYFDGHGGKPFLGIATLFIHPHGPEEESQIDALKRLPEPLISLPELPELRSGLYAFVVTSKEGKVGAGLFQLPITADRP